MNAPRWVLAQQNVPPNFWQFEITHLPTPNSSFANFAFRVACHAWRIYIVCHPNVNLFFIPIFVFCSAYFCIIAHLFLFVTFCTLLAAQPEKSADDLADVPGKRSSVSEKADENAKPAEEQVPAEKAEEKAEPAEKKVPAKKAEEKATPADKKAPSDVKQDDPSPEGATVSSAVEQPTIVKASVPRDPLPVTTVIGVPVGIAPVPKATQEGDVPVPSATDGAVIYSKPAPACQLVGGPNKGANPKPKAPTLADVKPKPPPPTLPNSGLPCSTIVPLAKIDETVPEFAKPREDDNQSCLGMLFSNFYLLFFSRVVFFSFVEFSWWHIWLLALCHWVSSSRLALFVLFRRFFISFPHGILPFASVPS